MNKMTREKKIEKIIEFFKQLVNNDSVSDEDLDKLYISFKFVVETHKELHGDNDE